MVLVCRRVSEGCADALDLLLSGSVATTGLMAATTGPAAYRSSPGGASWSNQAQDKDDTLVEGKDPARPGGGNFSSGVPTGLLAPTPCPFFIT